MSRLVPLHNLSRSDNFEIGDETRITYAERLIWVFSQKRARTLSFASERKDGCGLAWRGPGLLIVEGLIDRISRAPFEGAVSACWAHWVHRSGSLHHQRLLKNAMLC